MTIATSAIVTISVGVAATQAGQDSDPAMLVGAADRALYVAKQQGRNCICVAGVDAQEPTEPDCASSEANRRRPRTAERSPPPYSPLGPSTWG
ncbi:GGDEF domain-containing protein [Paraburkholderia sp. DD10]|uniref:GGDEF domain-containing protein n=1 Tax=Paraburkholderia sp. DD10 TaxID=3409691 RepID=UPI003BA26FCC